jgi:hypothetical protein
MNGGRFCTSTSCCTTSRRRRRKSTCGTVSPNASPCLIPVPAASTTSARYRSGSASAIANTVSVSSGTTRLRSIFGSEMRSHGLTAMSRVGDRALEDRREMPVDDLHGRRLHLLRELLDERLDLGTPDRSDRPVLELRENVVAHVGVDLHLGRRPVHARRLPFLRVLTEPLPAAGRVDVRAVREVAADLVEPQLRVALLDEAARALRAVGRAVTSAPRCPAAPIALLDVGHGQARVCRSRCSSSQRSTSSSR